MMFNLGTVHVDYSNLKECKLFMSVTSVDGIPTDNSCLANCGSVFICEIEISKSKSTCVLNPQRSDKIAEPVDTTNYVPCRGKTRTPRCWNLAEYYGQTTITITLKAKKLFRKKVVGKRVIKLSELLGKQQEHTIKELLPGAWSVSHQIVIPTRLSLAEKLKKISKRSGSTWLETAKSASNSLSQATAAAPSPLSLSAEKERAALESGANNLRGQSYEAIPAEVQDNRFLPKCAYVTVHIEYRLIQLQNCLCLGLSATAPLVPTMPLCTRQVIADDNISADPSAVSVTEEVISLSELHLLAATAPSGVVVEVMRALARKDSLPSALEICTTGCKLDHATCIPTHPPRSLELSSRRGEGSTSRVPAVPNSSFSAFDLALLYRQENTVLEMLQRCGSLCFANITMGKASPLHFAVRGGSTPCVEYLGRYLKKYGARKVTGPGARLWNSSLSAKLEWRDEQDDTVLGLACRCAGSASAYAIAIYLLILGSDSGAVNNQSKYTPLMYACHSGAGQLISALLSIVKSTQDITDGILNVGDVTSILNNTAVLDVEPAVRAEIQVAIASAAQAARSGALAVHLYANQRSSNILRGRNPAEGGYFNPLAMYLCDPARRDDLLGRHALHIATQYGSGEMVGMLLEIGMSCADVDFMGDNAFHIAARRGDRAVVLRLIEYEQQQWTVHKDLVKQGKSLEVMLHRAQALLGRNVVGDTPVDVAMEARHFSAAHEFLKAAVQTYGSIPPRLAAAYYRQLEICVAIAHSPGTLSPGFPHPSPRCNSGSSTPTSPRQGERLNSTERHIGACFKLLTGSMGDSSLPCSSGVRIGVLEEEQPDDAADSVEYMLALSQLGLKHITETAGACSISYLPGFNPAAAGNPVAADSPHQQAQDAAIAVPSVGALVLTTPVAASRLPASQLHSGPITEEEKTQDY